MIIDNRGAQQQHSQQVVQCQHVHLQEAQHHQLEVLHGGAQQLLLQLQDQLQGPDSQPDLLWSLQQVCGLRLLGLLRQEQRGQESGQQTLQHMVQTLQVSHLVTIRF